jgi:hypothetical protein
MFVASAAANRIHHWGIAMLYQGSCHCGAVSFEVEGQLEQAIECNCSHCNRKGYLLWFVPRPALKLKSPAENELGVYTFNKHVIRHHFCEECGCAPFGFGSDPKGNQMAAVNVRCLEDIDRGEMKIISVDGKSF